MLDWAELIAVCAIFTLAGGVKGLIGFGLPAVSLGLLTAMLDLVTAISLLIIPSFVTNSWQAVVGGYGKILWRRLWLFFLLAALTIWAGTLLLAYSRLSSLLLGVVFVSYALSSIIGVRRYAIPRQRETLYAMLFGAINGVFTGMTGNFAFPGVLFLKGIGLSRDSLVQAMGILFTISTVVLAAAMLSHGLLTAQLNVLSAAAVIPAVAGMAAGRWLRHRLPEARFERVFYAGIFLLGVYIFCKSLFYLSEA